MAVACSRSLTQSQKTVTKRRQYWQPLILSHLRIVEARYLSFSLAFHRVLDIAPTDSFQLANLKTTRDGPMTPFACRRQNINFRPKIGHPIPLRVGFISYRTELDFTPMIFSSSKGRPILWYVSLISKSQRPPSFLPSSSSYELRRGGRTRDKFWSKKKKKRKKKGSIFNALILIRLKNLEREKIWIWKRDDCFRIKRHFQNQHFRRVPSEREAYVLPILDLPRRPTFFML